MKSKGFTSSLRFKVMAFILLGGLVQCAVIMFVTYRYFNVTLVEALQEQGLIVAESIEEQAAALMIEEDPVGLTKIVENYRHQKSNEYIIIVDADYNIVTDTYGGAVPAVLKLNEVYENYDLASRERYELAEIEIAGQAVYDIRMPIKEGFLGFVRVGLKKSYVSSRVNEAVLFIGLIIVAGMLLASVIALWVITSQVARPIDQLITAAKEISLGNFNTPVQVQVQNELQELAAAIERMKESLKTSLERLRSRSTIGRF